MHTHATTIHRENPVEYFDARRNANDHRGNSKYRIHICAGTHRKEVVQPDKHRDDGDNHRGFHHRTIAIEFLA